MPEWIPATLVGTGHAQVVFWYIVAEELSAAQMEAALDVVWRIHRVLLATAAAKGWVVSDVDLRFLPAPTDATAVVAAKSSRRVYTIAEMTSLLDSAEIPTRAAWGRESEEWAERFRTSHLVLAPEDVIVDPESELPDEILDPLLEADQTFRDTWLRRRSDLSDRQRDYDRELTRLLADHKVDPQEIVDGIIHHRRMHGRKPELRVRHFRQLLSQEWRREQAEPPKSAPQPRVPRSDRRQVCLAANDPEQAILEELARREGQTISNYLRALAGMPPVYQGRPDPIQEARREDWIWDKLRALGIDTTRYYPDE